MLLSIITGTYQSDVNIFETTESITPLINDKIEWIIKDSSPFVDETLFYNKKLHGAKIVFQKDNSLYQGLNQALKLSTGKYFLVLGAGDTLTKNSIPEITSQLEQNESDDKVDIFCYSMQHKMTGAISSPNPLNLHIGMTCPHPSLIMKTEYARELNYFDEKYLIASDYDLTLRYFTRYKRYLLSNKVISEFKGGGLSEVKTEETALETMLIKIRNNKFIQELNAIRSIIEKE